jgi:hypothetical protein
MVSAVGRRARVAVVAAAVIALLAGSFYGQDDHFPFGPFRMFSTRTVPDGEVTVAQLRGRVAGDAREVVLPMGGFGLRRAEVEGQLGRLSKPGMLAELVKAREAVRSDLPSLDALRLVQVSYLLRDGRKVGERETTVAQWHR